MVDDNTPLLLLTTCPGMITAKKIAKELIAEKHASCINIIPKVSSYFIWAGKVQDDNKECLLLIKTTTVAYPGLEKLICSIHPYNLPEIIAIPIKMGLRAYLDWIKENTKNT